MAKKINSNIGGPKPGPGSRVKPHLTRPRNVDGVIRDIPVPGMFTHTPQPTPDTNIRPHEYDLATPVAQTSGTPVFSWLPIDKQTIALSRTENEIYYGGGRGGGKSVCQHVWLARPAMERLNGVLRYPNYNALQLRRFFQDLKGWIQEATTLWKKFEPGLQAVGTPTQFRWPGGPVIDTGHLDGERGFENYQGQQRHKLGIDEINQIPREDIYLPMLGSVRMSPDGYSQVFATGNPGGEGDYWIKDRWINVKVNGEVIPWGTPFLDPQSGLSRIFIQSLVMDNPYWANDPSYIKMLKSQTPTRQRQWIYGDWDAVEGSFFTDFRRRHLKGEPREAYHCVHSSTIDLKPYYRRWISVDWGYNDLCAVYWWVQHEDGRVYTYKEMVLRKIPSFQIGSMIARETYKDLSALPENSLELFLSPDTFRKDDAPNCRAEQIREGIESVLGRNTSTLLAMNDDERSLAETDKARAMQNFVQRVAETLPSSGITIRPANNNRVDGWAFMIEMLRWEPVDSIPEIDELQELIKDMSNTDATRYVNRILNTRRSDKVLPKWRIFEDKCPNLVKTIPLARTNSLKPNDILDFSGVDPLDSARYGLMGYRDMPAEMPKAYYIHEMLERYKRFTPNADINVMHAIWERANREWQERKNRGKTITRMEDMTSPLDDSQDDWQITELTSPFEWA